MTKSTTTHQLERAVARSRSHTAVQLVQSSQFARRLAKLLLFGLFLSTAAMLLLPWQQTSRGAGQVVAYAPQERQQSIEAQAAGIVARIGEGLVEGSWLTKGDFILEIQPFASDMVEQLEGQLKELNTKLDTEIVKADAYNLNVTGFTEARDFAVSAARQLVESAEAKLSAKQRLVPGYEAKELQASLNYERQNTLLESGIKSPREIEKLKREWDVTISELDSVRQDVKALEKELAAKQDELEEKRRIAQTKIDYARASRQGALGSAATIRKEIRDLEIKKSEMRRLIVTAHRDGTILRMPAYEQGDAIKAGDPILTFVPESTQNAVELYISGNDMPLVQVDQEVRLQFEGWPAVQFAGWPSVAIGTFGGTVANVDATNNGKGQFRILVVPNETEQEWPADRYLRQGVRANGWVMMRRVSLGYEIWRLLNGFPIMISERQPGPEKNKLPKLPK